MTPTPHEDKMTEQEPLEVHIADLVDPESGAVRLGALVYLADEVDAARAADAAKIARLSAQVGQQAKHIEVCEHIITEHGEFGGLFQPGGRFYELADLLLGGSAVVEGGRWLVERYDDLVAENAALRDNNTRVKELFDERAKEVATLRAERDAAQQELAAVRAQRSTDDDGTTETAEVVQELRDTREELSAAQQQIAEQATAYEARVKSDHDEIVEMTQQIATLTEAATWVAYVAGGVGRAGGEPEPGEAEEAMKSLVAALQSTRPQEQP